MEEVKKGVRWEEVGGLWLEEEIKEEVWLLVENLRCGLLVVF